MTETESLWTKVKNARIASIKSLEESLIIEKAILELSEKKIEEENK